MQELEPFFRPPARPIIAAGKPSEQGGDDKDRGPVRTQMVGESPGDDLGYDPKIIPTEKIPDDDEDDDADEK